MTCVLARTILADALGAALAFAKAAAAERAARGTFTGASGHVATGSVTLEKVGDASVVRLGEDFSLDGAPDPKVAIGAGGYSAAGKLGHLRANAGAQDYPAPATVDAGAAQEVWIWCERFNVPLGHATLTR